MPICMLPGLAAFHVFVLFAYTSTSCRLFQPFLPAAMCSLATAKQAYSPLLQLAGFQPLRVCKAEHRLARGIQAADHSDAIAYNGEPAWQHLARSLKSVTK